MKNNGILSERKDEMIIQSKDDLEGLKEYLDEIYIDTVENFDWLGSVLTKEELKSNSMEELKKKYNGVGELKIEIKISHLI